VTNEHGAAVEISNHPSERRRLSFVLADFAAQVGTESTYPVRGHSLFLTLRDEQVFWRTFFRTSDRRSILRTSFTTKSVANVLESNNMVTDEPVARRTVGMVLPRLATLIPFR
jgi:hypothetical protein